MIIWNPWHGCHKVSEGCQHCYMYFLDRMRGIDTSKVSRNANFDMPLKRGRDGRFKVAPGMELLVGLSTDFFVEEADTWRDEAWAVRLARRGMGGDPKAPRCRVPYPHQEGGAYPRPSAVRLGRRIRERHASGYDRKPDAG